MEGRGVVDSLSPSLVAGVPHQPRVQLKARCLEATLGCSDHLEHIQLASQNTDTDNDFLLL